MPDYEKMADRITAVTAQKIERESGLVLCGTGGGMMDHIRMMAMSFNCYNEITVEQGRELLIYCVNQYLSAINTNKGIKQYLVHFPFTQKDVEIRIFIRKPDHSEVSIGLPSVISQINGQLVYKVKQLGPVSLKESHEETYEEAVKLLETEGVVDKIRRKVKERSSV
jgi:hypothetical protein